jgi:A/G-specific adenine glycosylase
MAQNRIGSLTPEASANLAQQLLRWFETHARDLPWRHDRNPYRVWVAEVMLQQTQVDTVVPYYDRFLERFPDIDALADAALEDVLVVWEGLGYYARARRLHQAARQLVRSQAGCLPESYDALLEVPGVGAYTAGAIASISFGERVPAVDGNVRRVLCRAFGIREDVTRAAVQRRLRELAMGLLPDAGAGTFNEALIELGATVCKPRRPTCDICPLVGLCRAYAAGEQEVLPVRRPNRRVPHYVVTAAVTVRADGAILVAQRNLDDMLGGLWEFPGGKCEDGEELADCLVREIDEELGVEVEVGDKLAVIEHAYTHFRITLHPFWCRVRHGQPRCLDCAAFRWVSRSELEQLPMSVADRRIAQMVVAM